mgnify:CR=1 FL=1
MEKFKTIKVPKELWEQLKVLSMKDELPIYAVIDKSLNKNKKDKNVRND